MKNLYEHLKNIDEGMGGMKGAYRASLLGVKDNTGMDMVVTILLSDKDDTKEFEKWAEAQEGDTFSHIQGGNIEY